MEMADLIYQLVTDMDFDVVVTWAGILGIETIPCPDWEYKLRNKVVEVMSKIGKL